jgi:hypothetical protein
VCVCCRLFHLQRLHIPSALNTSFELSREVLAGKAAPPPCKNCYF